MTSTNIFILTSEWHDYKGRNALHFFGLSDKYGPAEIIIDRVKPVFFVDRDADIKKNGINFLRKNVNMKNFAGRDVDVLYFNTQRELKEAAEKLHERGITTYESDVDPVRRYLMERFLNAGFCVEGTANQKTDRAVFINPKIKAGNFDPVFKIASIDIETGARSGALYSIAMHITGGEEEKKIVLMEGQRQRKAAGYVEYFESEEELLKGFISRIKKEDPDIIIGWHVIGFDLMFLERKCNENNIPFDIGRGSGRVTLKRRKYGGYFAALPGRIIIDGPAALRSSFYTFDDYKLETVAQELLGTGKIITPDQDKIREIDRLFREDKSGLAEYNITDCVLVSEIFKKTGLIDLSVKRAKISGLLMDQLGMMTAAFDHFYLPRLHRSGYVAPTVSDIEEREHAAGGYVFDPKPGIYDDVVVLDFKSLYPSIIRTFKIDPLSRLLSVTDTITSPSGHSFSSSKHILPDFIDELMKQRSTAKKSGDKYLSQAIKILMNSFYGVMGAYNCRFYHPDLPSAITESGQKLLLGSKSYLEKDGYEAVYGDTDSLFIRLKKGEGDNADKNGERLASQINDYWKEKIRNEYGADSYLEMEYEKYYRKFIITPARGSDTGAKKRYAGLQVKNGKENLDFVGMEFVRSDWTRLAKEFQVELYERIFHEKEIPNWIRSVVQKVNAGEYDDKLIYKKRLRKDIDEYTKNIPPQVKAARMIGTTSGTVYYYITKRGPVPAELEHGDLDYQHYIEKQLKPIADSVLVLLGESFDSITKSKQLSFF